MVTSTSKSFYRRPLSCLGASTNEQQSFFTSDSLILCTHPNFFLFECIFVCFHLSLTKSVRFYRFPSKPIRETMLTKSNRFLWNSARIFVCPTTTIEQKRCQSVLTMENLNPLVKEVEYAVRGKKCKTCQKQ